MPSKSFVYPHPINVFLIRDQKIPVEHFCALYGYKQSRISTWITRERRIQELPADFIYCLSLISGLSMDNVYNRLLLLQDEYVEYTALKRKKKNVDI